MYERRELGHVLHHFPQWHLLIEVEPTYGLFVTLPFLLRDSVGVLGFHGRSPIEDVKVEVTLGAFNKFSAIQSDTCKMQCNETAYSS
jgi:hypothetical protein